MRFVIFGAGAIGGVVGARLHQAAYRVALIARGDHHDVIASDGLTLETPNERVTLRIPVARTPAELGIDADDVVLLSMKGQDTWDALLGLRAVAPEGVAVACLQNGVENERLALRVFADVYGVLVMMPTAHLEPGVVQAFGADQIGTLDLGRYPSGIDERVTAMTAAFTAAGIESTPREEIMPFKYAKLLNNLGNAIQAVCGLGDDPDLGRLRDRVREEGQAALRAAGIAFDAPDVTDMDGRWRRWGVAPIAGKPRGGGSSWQSATRGTPIESDYLNGEIALLGRQFGVATPANVLLQSLAQETVREHHQPGWLSAGDVLRRLDQR